MLGTVTPLLKQSVTVLEEIKLGPVTQSRISTVIAMLPISFASRISPFSSPRRSNSLHNLREKDVGDGSPGKPRPLSEADAMVLAGGRLDGQLRTDEDSSVVNASEPESPPLPSRVLFQNTRIEGVPTRSSSGVHLNFARQGTNLVAVSVQGHQYGLDTENNVFERKTYIDGLTYLLRGLPQELEPYEAEQLRLALPKDVGVFEGAPTTARTTPAHERSLLHRIVQAIVVNLILVFHLVTPYLVLCLRYGAKMERKYKVSSTLVERGIDLAATAGKRGAALTDTMWKLNDSKAGRILCDVVAWILDGISRGVSDGIGEGLVSSGTKSTV